MTISKAQLARLQTVYSQLARREIGMDGREERLRWASERVGRQIASFSELTPDEATFLIDGIQAQLGIKAPYKGRPGRDAARRAGLDGRKDGREFAGEPQLASQADLGRIQRLLDQMGWDQQRFRTFLASSRSPLARRADKCIRTTEDANKVWWALKRIAKSSGGWRQYA